MKGTAAWLSPAAMYSPVVPAGTKVSEFALGRWGDYDLCMAFVCHAVACQHLLCHEVVTGVQVVALSIDPQCRHST